MCLRVNHINEGPMPQTALRNTTNEKINIGLTEDQRSGLVETLNQLLADEHVLYVKTRKYHWNVMGPRFHDLHIFFEKQYDQIAATIDEVAENARQFGGLAAGTMTEFLQTARLKEQPGRNPDEDGMISDLLADHETIINALRKDIERADKEFEAAEAADFLTGVLEQHNKMAWMLRSFLHRQG
jgi:starvation-inducible DNA-binding protein